MIPNLLIMDAGGEVLVEKHYVPGFKRSVCDVFWEEAGKHESKEHIPPVINTPKYYLVHVYRHSLFILTAVSDETEPLFILELQQRLMSTIEAYLDGAPTATSIRRNFFVVLEMMDELIDGGFPMTTELNSLTVRASLTFNL
jgi:AP-3 complex subunit mu